MGRYDNIILPVASQKLSVSQFGAPVKAAIDDLDSRVSQSIPTATRVKAYNNAGVSLANGVLVVVPLQAESWKAPTSMHSNVTNNSRLIAPVNGTYQLDFTIAHGTNSVGRRVGQIRKGAAGSPTGGTQLWSISIGPTPSSGASVTFCGNLPLLQNDYVELFALQLSGGALSTGFGEYDLYMGLTLIDFA
jgi:hypothetical protein